MVPTFQLHAHLTGYLKGQISRKANEYKAITGSQVK